MTQYEREREFIFQIATTLENKHTAEIQKEIQKGTWLIKAGHPGRTDGRTDRHFAAYSSLCMRRTVKTS